MLTINKSGFIILVNSRILYVLLLFLHLFCCTSNINAQNPVTSLYRNYNSIYLQPTVSSLKHSNDEKYIVSLPALSFGVGYNYIIPLKRFYEFGFGATANLINYRLALTDYSYSNILISEFSISVPIYIGKHYPFNDRFAMYVKTGVNICKFLSVFDSGYGLETDLQQSLNIHPIIDPTPQIGILFELGGDYSLKNNNFLSIGIVINKNFINKVQLNYEYFEEDSDTPFTGSFQSTGSTIGLTLRYNFKTTVNENN